MPKAVSRRSFVRASAVGAVGVAGVAALAACGETQVVTKEVPVEVEKIVTQVVEKIVKETEVKEVPVDRVVTKVVQEVVTQTEVKEVQVEVEKVVTQVVEVEKVVEKVVEVEAAPQAVPVAFEHISDHTSGPRAQSMQWALERYAQVAPHVTVVFTPNSGNIGDTIPIRIAAGTMSESALLDGSFIFLFGPDGVFRPINDILAKHPDFDPANYVYLTDQFTADLDLTWPYRTEWDTSTPIYGMPYQHVAGGMAWNIDMFESAGIEEPQDTWTYGGEFRETAKRLTDPDTGDFGTLVLGGNDIHIWTPMAYGMGAKQLINPEATHTSIFDDGGIDGLKLAVGLVLEDEVAPPVEAARELAGEFGNLFQAGRAGMWPRRADGTGYMVASIKDRFRWSLGPQPKGDVTGTSANHRQDQPHLITDAAFKRGTEEAVVDFLVYMSGPDVQARVAVDRGFAPVNWEAMSTPGATAPPPLGMEWVEHSLRNYDTRRWPKYHPSFLEWLAFRGMVHPCFLGDESPEESAANAVAHGDGVLEAGLEGFQRVSDYFGGPTG